MNRARVVLGMVIGVVLALSALAHSLVGWPVLRARIEATGAPADLVTGLAIGWHFAGVAMFLFGAIVMFSFSGFAQGRAMPLLPARLIAVSYLAFGAWALVASAFDPFFLIFIIPGALLFIASWGVVPLSPLAR